jgi:hypothetical protein
MDIWLQMYELGVFLLGGVFVTVVVAAFIWFKCFRNEINY